MITLFTGSPGAGKTLSLVDYLSSLTGDRPIYVDGLEGLTLPHTDCDANNWHTDLPEGAILVVDEAQRIWRPRGSGSKVPDSVAAMETHRHHGIDIYLTTQAPALIDSNVRNLVGRHIHIRDTGILGRYWYEWPETNTGCSWKTCINKRKLKLNKKTFELYKSSSLHVSPVRGIPPMLYWIAILLVLSAFLIFRFYKGLSKTIGGSPAASAPAAHASPSADPSGASMSAFGGSGVRPPPDDRVDFIPRISYKPETARAYDHLRVVTVMPIVSSAICVNEVCKCYTQQATNTGLSSAECLNWVQNPPFNPYLAVADTASAGNQNSSRSAPAQVSTPSRSGAVVAGAY